MSPPQQQQQQLGLLLDLTAIAAGKNTLSQAKKIRSGTNEACTSAANWQFSMPDFTNLPFF